MINFSLKNLIKTGSMPQGIYRLKRGKTMAQKAIREYSAKLLLANHWKTYFPDFKFQFKSILAHTGEDLKNQAELHDWLKSEGLVVKPDMLFGKRGLNQLVFLQNNKPGDVDLDAAANWIDSQSSFEKVLICGARGSLKTFIVEPFFAHDSTQEMYISCSTTLEHDILYLSAQGGVDIENNWDSVREIKIPLDINSEELSQLLLESIPSEFENPQQIASFAGGFYHFFKDMHFCYLELNPFVLQNQEIHLLDVVAKMDDTARFLMQSTWGDLQFPRAFGEKETSLVEQTIEKLDEKSGASLKLTVLKPEGLVWTLVAGGGASVVYADSIANLWGVEELANYGEYSGNPTMEETYCYTRGVLELMTKQRDSQNRDKVLIIGGSIANFTDVAKTFDGIIKAFNEMYEEMKKVGVNIYVRRGGPNYEIGLKNIETAATRLGLPIKVYGPETHLTDIVRQALIMHNEGVNV